MPALFIHIHLACFYRAWDSGAIESMNEGGGSQQEREKQEVIKTEINQLFNRGISISEIGREIFPHGSL